MHPTKSISNEMGEPMHQPSNISTDFLKNLILSVRIAHGVQDPAMKQSIIIVFVPSRTHTHTSIYTSKPIIKHDSSKNVFDYRVVLR